MRDSMKWRDARTSRLLSSCHREPASGMFVRPLPTIPDRAIKRDPPAACTAMREPKAVHFFVCSGQSSSRQCIGMSTLGAPESHACIFSFSASSPILRSATSNLVAERDPLFGRWANGGETSLPVHRNCLHLVSPRLQPLPPGHREVSRYLPRQSMLPSLSTLEAIAY
jgi:hypothetical protein